MNWYDLAPYPVAQAQTAWERRRQVQRAIAAAGLRNPSYREIAELLGCTQQKARKLSVGRLAAVSPIERWLGKLDNDLSILRSRHPPKVTEMISVETDGLKDCSIYE